jgi:hypothetical protein
MARIARNLAVLLLLGLPLWLAGLWIVARLAEGSQASNRWPEAASFYFLVLAPQMLLGGIVHQLVLAVAPIGWSRAARRAFAIATSIVIPLVLLLLGGSASVLLAPMNLVCLGAALLVYDLLIQLPARSQGSA